MNSVLQVAKDMVPRVLEFLTKHNLERKEISSGEAYRSSSVVISVYNSGKVLFQGKDSEKWFQLLKDEFSSHSIAKAGNEVSSKANPDQGEKKYILEWPRIGTDESGKGDFYGPLVTASFLIKSVEVERRLHDLGVTDSKKLTDKTIIKLASEIKSLGPYGIVKINPPRYNSLYKEMKNINTILGWSHARAIENLLSQHECSLVVSDQFGDEEIIKKALFEHGKNVNLIQMHKAESDMAVAAASILARASFVEAVNQLGRKIGISLPLGASNEVIRTGIRIVTEKGPEGLNEVAKLHFKTFEKIKDMVR